MTKAAPKLKQMTSNTEDNNGETSLRDDLFVYHNGSLMCTRVIMRAAMQILLVKSNLNPPVILITDSFKATPLLLSIVLLVICLSFGAALREFAEEKLKIKLPCHFDIGCML